MKNRNLDHKDHWATPPKFYLKIDQEFSFTFDPCLLHNDFEKYDGITGDWGKRNFINPPYSLKLKEAFVKRAVCEARAGKLCVMLLPVSTSTKLFHDIIKPNAKEIRFIRGRIPFIGINNNGEYVNWNQWHKKAPEGVKHVNNSGQHDSMIVIF